MAAQNNIGFVCPHCGRSTYLAKSLNPLGKKKKCKGCGRIFDLNQQNLQQASARATTQPRKKTKATSTRGSTRHKVTKRGPAQAQFDELVPVGFGRRFCALLLDALFSGICAFLLATVLGIFFGTGSGLLAGMVWFLFGMSMGPIFYNFIEGIQGASLGKVVLDLQIGDADGGPATPTQYMQRYLLKNALFYIMALEMLTHITILNYLASLLGLVVFIGGFWIFSRRRQTLYDILAHTCVYRRHALQALAALPPELVCQICQHNFELPRRFRRRNSLPRHVPCPACQTPVVLPRQPHTTSTLAWAAGMILLLFSIVVGWQLQKGVNVVSEGIQQIGKVTQSSPATNTSSNVHTSSSSHSSSNASASSNAQHGNSWPGWNGWFRGTDSNVKTSGHRAGIKPDDVTGQFTVILQKIAYKGDRLWEFSFSYPRQPQKYKHKLRISGFDCVAQNCCTFNNVVTEFQMFSKERLKSPKIDLTLVATPKPSYAHADIKTEIPLTLSTRLHKFYFNGRHGNTLLKIYRVGLLQGEVSTVAQKASRLLCDWGKKKWFMQPGWNTYFIVLGSLRPATEQHNLRQQLLFFSSDRHTRGLNVLCKYRWHDNQVDFFGYYKCEPRLRKIRVAYFSPQYYQRNEKLWHYSAVALDEVSFNRYLKDYQAYQKYQDIVKTWRKNRRAYMAAMCGDVNKAYDLEIQGALTYCKNLEDYRSKYPGIQYSHIQAALRTVHKQLTRIFNSHLGNKRILKAWQLYHGLQTMIPNLEVSRRLQYKRMSAAMRSPLGQKCCKILTAEYQSLNRALQTLKEPTVLYFAKWQKRTDFLADMQKIIDIGKLINRNQKVYQSLRLKLQCVSATSTNKSNQQPPKSNDKPHKATQQTPPVPVNHGNNSKVPPSTPPKMPSSLTMYVKEAQKLYQRDQHTQLIYILQKIQYRRFSRIHLAQASQKLREVIGKDLKRLAYEAVYGCKYCGSKGKLTCPRCHGRGRIRGTGSMRRRRCMFNCRYCNGKGRIPCYKCYRRRYSKRNKKMVEYFQRLNLTISTSNQPAATSSQSHANTPVKKPTPKPTRAPKKRLPPWERGKMQTQKIPQVKAIVVDGIAKDWQNIPVFIQDKAGDAAAYRNQPYFDIVSVKMAHDRSNLYILMECAQSIQTILHADRTRSYNIAIFYFDTDNNKSTGRPPFSEREMEGIDIRLDVVSAVQYQKNFSYGGGGLGIRGADIRQYRQFFLYTTTKAKPEKNYLGFLGGPKVTSLKHPDCINYRQKSIELKIPFTELGLKWRPGLKMRVIFEESMGKWPKDKFAPQIMAEF